MSKPLLLNNRLRWTLSLVSATSLLVTTLWLVLHSEDDFTIEEPPPLELTFVELKEQPKEPPKELPKPKPKPRPKPKPKKKPIVKKPKEVVKEAAIAEKVIVKETEPVEEEPSDEPITEEPVDVAEPVVDYSPARISSAKDLDNSNFSPVYNPKPTFPSIAKRAGSEGYVDVDLLINEEGRVDSYSVVSVFGHQSFAKELKKVLTKWRFPPPRMKGRKRKVKYIYRVNFVLH